jgi:hypothetical protein
MGLQPFFGADPSLGRPFLAPEEKAFSVIHLQGEIGERE